MLAKLPEKVVQNRAMSVIEHAKELADLIQKVGDIELYRKIVALQGEVVQLSTRNFELEKQSAELKAALEQKRATRHERSLLWREGDPVPFCPLCAENNDRHIHMFGVAMSGANVERWACSICHHEFTAKDGKAFGAHLPRHRL